MKRLAALVLGVAAATVALAGAPKGHDVTDQPDKHYSTCASSLDSVGLLPTPPMPIQKTDKVNSYDEAAYINGKRLRTAERGALAILDANGSKVHESFSGVFGIPITKEETPEIYKMIKNLRGETGSLAPRGAKKHYFRIRPFVYYGEPTCYKPDEERLSKDGSYPSGHSARAWAIALILAEINTMNKDAIYQRGYDMGQSRVICGYHWQSDVDAGRLVGAANVSYLHNNRGFMAQFVKAKAEFVALRKAGKIKKVEGKK